jgi:hypothetical protein
LSVSAFSRLKRSIRRSVVSPAGLSRHEIDRRQMNPQLFGVELDRKDTAAKSPCEMDAASERIAGYVDCGHNNHARAGWQKASRWSLG